MCAQFLLISMRLLIIFSFSLRDVAVVRWSLEHFSPVCQVPRENFYINLLVGCQGCTTYIRREGRGSLGNLFFFFSVCCPFTQLCLVLPLSYSPTRRKTFFLWALWGRNSPPESSKGNWGSEDLDASWMDFQFILLFLTTTLVTKYSQSTWLGPPMAEHMVDSEV